MRKACLLLFACCILTVTSYSVSAYPHKIAVWINGQQVFIHLYGDEHSKRVESEDGYTIIQNEKQQWCYASLKNDSTLEATQWLLGYEDSQNATFRNFINTTPKHLVAPNNRQQKTITNRKASDRKVVGQRRILIILMEYKDVKFSKNRVDFDRLFNEEGYSVDNAQGSVKDFYLSASYNQLELESDIYGPYSASYDMSYYGRNSGINGHDVNPYALFEEAITNVAREADLAQYDCDGDGFIDNVHIIFAGYGEEAGASSNAIWSHEAAFNRPYEIQGMKIDKYSCAPELRGNSGTGISRIGPHCHEIGHALGAMDYYDVDYSTGGEYAGTGMWDIMASGSWNNDGITPADFNPYVKAYNYGWISPTVLPQGNVIIPPSCHSMENYYILQSSEYGDFYMLENRSKENWGAGLPGEGLLIFHVHNDIVNAGNNINATAPQKCYIVCASSKNRQPSNTPASYGDINSSGCPYPGNSGNHNFGQSSVPMAFYWNGEPCPIEINNITTAEDKCVSLTNNSIGADFEPVEMGSLFFEGFEDEYNVNIHESSGTAWQVEKSPENTTTFSDKPSAYEGIRSLQLSARNSHENVSGAFEFCSLPTTDSMRKRLTLYVTAMNLRLGLPNIITVYYRTTDDSDWQTTEISVTENNKWKQTIVELPINASSQFKIEGTAFAGSIIAIDNISIEEEIGKENTQHRGLKIPINEKYSIYTIDGIKRKQISNGINILKMPDGTCKKVFKLLTE